MDVIVMLRGEREGLVYEVENGGAALARQLNSKLCKVVEEGHRLTIIID